MKPSSAENVNPRIHDHQRTLWCLESGEHHLQSGSCPSIDAGMLLAPVGLFAIILSPIVGKNVNRVDPRWLASFAFVVFALVLLIRSHFNTPADFDTLMVPTLVQGIAMAFFFIPLSVILLSGIAPDKIPAASRLVEFCAHCGGLVWNLDSH